MQKGLYLSPFIICVLSTSVFCTGQKEEHLNMSHAAPLNSTAIEPQKETVKISYHPMGSGIKKLAGHKINIFSWLKKNSVTTLSSILMEEILWHSLDQGFGYKKWHEE